MDAERSRSQDKRARTRTGHPRWSRAPTSPRRSRPAPRNPKHELARVGAAHASVYELSVVDCGESSESTSESRSVMPRGPAPARSVAVDRASRPRARWYPILVMEDVAVAISSSAPYSSRQTSEARRRAPTCQAAGSATPRFRWEDRSLW